jgi:hypothetical protein
VPTVWLTLAFAEPVADGALGVFALSCDGELQPISAHRLDRDPHTVVVNPAGDLPADSDCELNWVGPDGEEILPFSVFAAGPIAQVPYDRTDPSTYAPFPDDIWLEPDATTRTGVRVDLPAPDREQDVQSVFLRMKTAAGLLDGFSPIGALVVELSEAPDQSSLPLTPTESLDPFATVGLFDLTPGSSGYSARVPFKLHVRAVRTLATPMQHALILFPSIPLTPGGQYGLVVTRRAVAAPDRPFDPSPVTLAALGNAMGGEDSAITEVRALTDDVLDALSDASPPIVADDVALVTRFSIRSNDEFPVTPLTMKQQVLNLPPPAFEITSVSPELSGEVAAIVQATWEAPEWRVSFSIARDMDGRPIVITTKDVPFILAIPRTAETTPVPIAMYQHGNPGSAENEVPWQARSYMAENGFAVMGFTDTITRDVGADLDAQRLAIMTPLLAAGILPEYWIQATGEQLSFLRLIEQLGDLDVLPYGDPDGQPDLDVSAALSYIGISEGANKGQAFVAYAPEVRAAALVVGGMRLGEILFYQDIIGPGGLGTATLDVIIDLIAPNLRPVDLQPCSVHVRQSARGSRHVPQAERSRTGRHRRHVGSQQCDSQPGVHARTGASHRTDSRAHSLPVDGGRTTDSQYRFRDDERVRPLRAGRYSRARPDSWLRRTTRRALLCANRPILDRAACDLFPNSGWRNGADDRESVFSVGQRQRQSSYTARPPPPVVLPAAPGALLGLGGAFAPGFALRARATAHVLAAVPAKPRGKREAFPLRGVSASASASVGATVVTTGRYWRHASGVVCACSFGDLRLRGLPRRAS